MVTSTPTTPRRKTAIMSSGARLTSLSFRATTLLLLLPFSLLPWVAKGEGYPLHKQAFVQPLTDEDFDEQTQAMSMSASSSTSSWLIWFHRKRDETIIAGPVPPPETWDTIAVAEDDAEDAASNNNNHNNQKIQLATVQAIQNYRTRARFEVKTLPAFVLLHKGQYYTLDAPPEGYVYNWDAIVAFARLQQTTTTFSLQSSSGQPIPPPRTWKDDVQFLWEKLKAELGGVYLQSMGAFFVFLTVFAIINKLFVDTTPNKAKRAAAAAKEKQS